jgi:RNA polymerase sigma-70 factor (ECF subfamily)
MVTMAEREVAGSREATFLDLYDLHALAVLRYLRTATPDGTDLENLCADVFARAWHAWPRFRGDADDARHWLFRIARNGAVDAGRRRHGVRLVALDAAAEVGIGRAPEDAAIERMQVRGALARLSPGDRELVALRSAGLSHQEIGVVLGRTEPAVKMAWHRAMTQMRKLLESGDD